MIECDDFDLDTGFYLIFMHSLSIVAVPLNVLAIYCILYKSKKQMGAYKWYLLIYQLTSTVFDFVYLALTLPVIFFPIPMGYPASWVAPWIAITTYSAIILVVQLGSFFAATIISLFIFRCHVITPTDHFSKINSQGHIYKSAIVFVTYIVPAMISTNDFLPDQGEARIWAEQEYSCAKSALSVPHLQIFIPYKTRRVVITLVVLSALAFVISICCITVSFRFLSKNGSMSRRTKDMQRRFLLYLTIQVSVPVLTMVLPITSLMYVFGTTNNTKRGFGNFMLALLGSHGCVAAIMLILCNEPYRRFALSPLIEYWRRKKPKVAISRSAGAYSNHQQIS